MNHLLRPRIWPSFLASSGVGPCDVPFRYASEPIPRYRGTVALWHAHLRGLATAIREISGLVDMLGRALINKDPAKRQYSKFLYDFKYLYDFCVRTAR
jgi:hypothetical protein